MDSRAAKGIAANIRAIAEATTQIALIDAGKVSGAEVARCEYTQAIEKAEARIAQWLQQPMTFR